MKKIQKIINKTLNKLGIKNRKHKYIALTEVYSNKSVNHELLVLGIFYEKSYRRAIKTAKRYYANTSASIYILESLNSDKIFSYN